MQTFNESNELISKINSFFTNNTIYIGVGKFNSDDGEKIFTEAHFARPSEKSGAGIEYKAGTIDLATQIGTTIIQLILMHEKSKTSSSLSEETQS